MVTAAVRGHFDAAHFLSGYDGKCRNIHGHRWEVEVKVTGKPAVNGEKRSMVADFGDIKRLLKTLTERFDHTLIFEHGSLSKALFDALTADNFALSEVHFRPTAEAFAEFFFNALCSMMENDCMNFNDCRLYAVTVFETPENFAAYTAEETV
jgi:6-pyruvoyltetrahydropterin/6-carboxytetrahydropterin synthase